MVLIKNSVTLFSCNAIFYIALLKLIAEEITKHANKWLFLQNFKSLGCEKSKIFSFCTVNICEKYSLIENIYVEIRI